MDLRQLRCFLAVAEELHFGRAAARLNMTQPPLSAQLKRLEATLGVRLFERSSRHVALTAAGRVLEPHARHVLAGLDVAADRARRAAAGRHGHLAIGFLHSVAYTILPDVLEAFRARFPEVELSLQEATTSEQLAALASGRLDLGFLLLPVPPGGAALRCVLRRPFVLAAPARHRLAGRAAVRIEELADEPLILYPRQRGDVGIGGVVAKLLAAAGVAPRPAQVVNTIHTALALVGAGLGCAVTPLWADRLGTERVAFVPLEGCAEEAAIGLAWREGDDPARAAFVELAAATTAAWDGALP